MAFDIHGYAKKLDGQLKMLEKGSMTPQNKACIKQFYSDCALEGLSKPRLTKNIEVLRFLGENLKKDFDQATIDDLKALVRIIDDKDYAAWTKVTYKVVLKRFYKWLKGNNEEYPAEIKWLKVARGTADNQMLSQNDLISEEEVQKVIEAASNPRDKAFLATLAESGCRIGELGNLCINNIALDKNGAVLTVTGKTGSRRIRIIQSVPHLATWLNCHPLRTNPDAPVWVNLCLPHKHMGYAGFCRIVRETFELAGIKKRCNPHLFRHSRASTMANHLTEFQMNHYFGWEQGSNMPSTYVHLSGKDLDGAILKMNGLDPDAPIAFKPRKCLLCAAINAPDSAYCGKCGTRHDLKPQEQQNLIVIEDKRQSNPQEMLNLLIKDPAVQKILAEKIVQMRQQN